MIEGVSIDRPELFNTIMAEAQRGHLLVLGEAGIGKSFLLEAVARELNHSGYELYYIEADHFELKSTNELDSAFGLPGPLLEALRALEREKKAFLFVDGLDGARNEITQAAFRELIRSVMNTVPNWTVIAGIRTYDALKSREIRELFGSGNLRSAAFSDPAIQQHHVLIPPLGASELNQAATQSSECKALFARARSEFLRLLTIPRNIEFAVSLLKSGVPLNELSEIQSEVHLLRAFWDHYVLTEPLVEQKRVAMKMLTSRMYERHLLSVDITDTVFSDLKKALQELLHDSILRPLSPGSNFLCFSNHTLFDFAVSRHLVPEEPIQAFLDFIRRRENQVFFNPSIRYFLAFQWSYRRKFFWEVIRLMSDSDDLNPSMKVMPFVTITEEAREIADIDGLVEQISGAATKSELVYYLLVSLLRHLKRQTERPPFWLHVLKRLLEYLDAKVWWLYVDALSWYGDRVTFPKVEANPEIMMVLGLCARTLLRKGWESSQPSIENVNAKRVVGLVCLTYESDRNDSREVLRNVLKRVGVPNVPVDEIYWLSEGVKEVIQHDPEFVVEVYDKVFGYEERSEESIPMGGVVLPMTSTRKQSYQLSGYHLQEAYERFLSTSPVCAAKALVRSVEGYIVNRERRPEEKIPVIKESGIKYCIDFSYIWDSNRDDEYEDVRKMLTQFEDWLSHTSDSKAAYLVFEEIVRTNCNAVIWRRILHAISKNPSVLSELGYRLLIAKPILVGRDTHFVASEVLPVVLPLLDEGQRRRLEQTILELTTYDASWEFIKERMKETLAREQAELLAVFPPELIITEDLRLLHERLFAESKLVKPKVPFEMSEVQTLPHVEKDWLKEQGVEVDNKENSRLLEISSELRVINSIFDDKTTTFEAVQGTWNQVDRLWIEYYNLTGKGDKRVRETTMTQFGEYVSKVCRYQALDLTSPFGMFIWVLVEHLISDPSPEFKTEYHSSLNSPSWSPAPRIEGVESLMSLLVARKVQIEQVGSYIHGLSKDQVPIIRFFIARHLYWIYLLNDGLFWSIVETILVTETKQTASILTALLHNLHNLISDEKVRPKSTAIVTKVLDILQAEDPDRAAQSAAYDILTELYVIHDDPSAKRIVDETVSRGLSASRSIFHILRNALATTIVGIAAGAGRRENADQIRAKSLAIVTTILYQLKKQINAIHENLAKYKQEEIRDLYRLVSVIGEYFSLDVDWGQEHQRKQIIPLQLEERRRYFSEVAAPVLSKLLEACNPAKDSGIPADTAHHLLELAPSLVWIDFKTVLGLVHGIVHASKPGGYPLDSFAMRDLEAFVDVCLADHRLALRDDLESLHLLTDILDVFVEVGWSEALGLVLRLDQIFS